MKDGNPSAGANLDSDLHQLLSTRDNAWDQCTLGPLERWPRSLTSFATTLSALPYPAAVLWGDEYVLIHNKAWDDAGGVIEQGQSQKSTFSANTLDILHAVIRQNNVREMQSDDLLQKTARSNNHYSVAILSPLHSAGVEQVSGIMVQLMPKPMQLRSGDAQKGNSNSAMIGADGQVPHDLVDAVDNAPIDEHPFFRRFAEMLPSGLAILDQKAQAVFVNQHFYDLTTLRGGQEKFTSWPQSIHEEDYDRVMAAYQEAFKSQRQLRTEFRARGKTNPWRLLLLTPLGDENLQHVSLREYGGFICSIVDITSEKSAEIAERKAAKQASERKEQQERFIDMISHEIRNPLSAVLHCAEDISDAIHVDGKGNIDIASIKEAVETINLCVTHQKNIVDDVLSFSKLDASLLSLVPKPSEPRRQLQSTLQMFQHEFRKQHLEFQYTVDENYDQCHVEWVMTDLARIAQVLINLVTNAIKFTHHAKGQKLIHITVGACVDRPKSYPPDVVFFESDNLAHKMDATNTAEWGNGQELYIMVAVRDTGIGISQDGQKRLFERFRQATPKTEEVYGGSGLGLNISRKICHLHGGEIGVSSKEEEGSTFGFFFKVRKTGPPKDLKMEQAEEKGGDEQVRTKIQSIEKGSDDQEPSSKEPFEWSPAGGDKANNITRSEPSREEAETHVEAQNEFSAGIASPVNDKDGQKQLDEYDQAKRPSLSKEHRTGQKLVSADVTTQTSPQDEEQGSRPITSLKGNGARAHVLLVEDNIINQKIVYRKLEAKGFNVTTANNGKEAVAAVQSAPKASSGDKGAFDVILMDQEMPILDGNGATKAIRELESKGEIEHIPILGVTANVRGAQQDEMLTSGMDDVISKPYKIEDMVSKITDVANFDPTQ